MALSLWISPDRQYGLPAIGEARQGAMRHALTQAIKQHLFADQSKDAEQSTYDAALSRFCEQIQPDLKVGKKAGDGQAAKQIWQALLSPQATLEPDAERKEALFIHALHTLCAVVAEQWSDEASRDRIDEEDDAETPDDAADAPTPGKVCWGAESFEVRNALARQLRQAAWKWQLGLPEAQRPEPNDWLLVAGVVLKTLLQALPEWFAESTGETRHRDGKPHTETRIEIVPPELAQRLERLLETLPLSFSPQPLRVPVAYSLDDPGPADDDAETCIRIDLIGYRQTNAFLRRAHGGLLKPAHRPPNFARYVEAINVQQAVQWRIDRPLLQCARQLIDLAKAPAADPEHKDLRDWIQDKLYRPIKGARKTFERPAEFLDNVLARRVLDELCPSETPLEPLPFYLPWKADHRGRIYPETPWFSPQGGDLQRALLEFARGQVLTEAGAVALCRHGANLVKRSRLLADLGIADRPVLTLDERERWTRDHEADILASAADPLAVRFWRDVADKPMQFLAFCLAYRQWKAHPEAPVHLPVQIDGTCNGIQHIAALTGDEKLAEAVNVLPRADGLPADIYSELAEEARKTLGELPAPKRKTDHHEGLALADAWLAADPDAWLNRKTAKGVVMTIPYGASPNAQARTVLEAIEGDLIKAWRERPLSTPELSALDALLERQNGKTDENQAKSDEKASNAFVKRLTRGFFAEACQAAFTAKKQTEAEQQIPPIPSRVVKPGQKSGKNPKPAKQRDHPDDWTPERREWERLRTFGAFVALALVKHLRDALDRHYPGVGEFSDWLEGCAKACAGSGKASVGLPILWLTPLGFPVVQNKFASTTTNVTARIGSQSVKLGVQRLTEDVDPYKQRAALLPNLIHSLDATHLTMTLLEAKARGVPDLGSIHDCLLCHPNQAETLARTVRATFAKLYAPDGKTGLPKPLRDWHVWMRQAVELHTLPRRGDIIGSLEQPGGLGERVLENDADRDQQDAKDACAWLSQFRTDTPPPEQWLLKLLLEYACDLKPPASPPVVPALPVSNALALSESAISPYFFS